MSILSYTVTLRFLESLEVELEPQYDHFLDNFPIA